MRITKTLWLLSDFITSCLILVVLVPIYCVVCVSKSLTHELYKIWFNGRDNDVIYYYYDDDGDDDDWDEEDDDDEDSEFFDGLKHDG